MTRNTSRHRTPRNSVAGAIRLAAACLFLCAAADDPVVATRGRDQLTLSQARALVATLPDRARQKSLGDRASLQKILRDTLLQRAILAEAQSQKWERRPDIAASLRRDHDAIVSQSYLASKASVAPSYPGDDEVQAAYERNKSGFMQPRRYHLLQLFTDRPTTAASPTGEKSLASLRAKLASSAMPMSQAAASGTLIHFADMGWVAETQLSPAAKAAVIGLQEGAMTDPLCIEGVCHLIRLVGTRPAAPAPVEEVHDALVRALRQERQQKQEQAYAASLLAKSPVMIDETVLARLKQ